MVWNVEKIYLKETVVVVLIKDEESWLSWPLEINRIDKLIIRLGLSCRTRRVVEAKKLLLIFLS